MGPVNAHNADAPLAKNKETLDFLDAPSDLVPGVYEGGLKTWECSLDLVEHLHELRCSSNFGGFAGNRVLEVSFSSASVFSLLLNKPLDWMRNFLAISIHPISTIFLLERSSHAFNTNPSTRLQYSSLRACHTSERLANLV